MRNLRFRFLDIFNRIKYIKIGNHRILRVS